MAVKLVDVALTITALCYLFTLLVLGTTEGQVSPTTLTLTSLVDVTSGATVCPNTRVEFTCEAVNTILLTWQRNGMEIRTISFRTKERQFQVDPFMLLLDRLVLSVDDRSANMTSRLVFNLSNVMSGDVITCSEVTNAEEAEMLNYQCRMAPNSLLPTDIAITIAIDRNNQVALSITWNESFTSDHDVTNYRVVVNGSSVARCPSVCLPSETCECIGPVVGENININVSAINCGDQEGPSFMLVAKPTLPSQPSMCSGLAVYDYMGDFIGIAFSWRRVDNPPEFTTGVRQDVAQYSVMAEGFATQTVSTSTACPTPNCSHLLLLRFPSSQSQIKGSVAAENVFGQGSSCILQELHPDSTNQLFTLKIFTSDGNNHTVECTQVISMRQGTFECEFCYGADTSCQNLQSGSCIRINESSAALPLLTEVTYCYRATARIDGRPLALIQGKFSTVCLPQALKTSVDTNITFNSSGSGSSSIPGGQVRYTGTNQGSVATYQCDEGYSLSGNVQRVCHSDGNWDGIVAKCVFVPLTGENLGFLVVSVLLWLVSSALIAFETVYIVIAWLKLCTGSKFFSITLCRPQKITYILLLTAGYTLLLVVFILWIVFGVAVGNPNMLTLRDSSIVAAFVFSSLAFIVVTVILIMIVYITRQKYRTHPTKGSSSDDNQVQATGSMKPLVGEEMYARPNGQQPSDDSDEHRMKQNAPSPSKSKGIIVKKKQKKVNKIEPQSQVEEYDQLKGAGRHLETDLDNRPTPISPPIPGQYGKLNREGQQEQYSVPYESKAVSTLICMKVERYETMSGQQFLVSGGQAKRAVTQTDGSGVSEYSVVDKKKKKSKPK